MTRAIVPTAAAAFQPAVAKDARNWRLNVAGTTDLIVDVAACTAVHEFHGNVADPARHGQLRHPNPDKVLIDTAVAKAQGNAYRPDYLRNHNKAFLLGYVDIWPSP